LGLLVLFLIAAAVAVFGWRYGFRPLPPIDPRVDLHSPYEVSLEQLPPDHPGFWIQRMQAAPGFSISGEALLHRFVSDYLRWGHTTATNRAKVAEWTAALPLLKECYDRVLATSDRRIVKWWSGRDSQRPNPTDERHLLLLYAIWQAAEAEHAATPARAFEHLLDGWRIAQALPGLDTPWGDGNLATAWRRLALTAPLPPRSEVLALLARLTATTATPVSLEQAFHIMAWPCQETHVTNPFLLAGTENLPLRKLMASAFGSALEETLEGAGRYIQWGLRRVAGGASETPPRFEGLRTFAEPLAITMRHVAILLARTNDLDHVHRAYVGGVLARLRAGHTNEAIAWAEMTCAKRPRAWYSLFDRPAAWSVPSATGSPAGCLERIRWHRVQVESCRLTLALRLYRETHRRWPNSLSPLVPDILPEIPLDPFSGQPFLYRRTDAEYVFATVGPVGTENRSPDWLLSTNRLTAHDSGRRQVFSSMDPALALAEWQRQQAQSNPTFDVRMLLRYGLLPRGTRILTQPPTATSPSTNTAQ